MHGVYGRILKIDLTDKTYLLETVDERIYRKYLGGKGLASYLLYTLNPGGVDPLSPDNHLVFATGPATGSPVWGASRYGVFTKSPQTRLYAESYSGGKVPEAMDATGFDAIVFRGKAEAPTVLVIDPDGATFHDATDLWGMGTYETEDIVNARYGATDGKTRSGSVVIGPAGENLVGFAVIGNDHWRCAGRTGMGAVMGSKSLKAVIFRGNRKRPLSDGPGVKAFSKRTALNTKDHPVVRGLKTQGTPRMVRTANLAGAFPTRYWSEGVFDRWEKISSEALHKQCRVKPRACAKCFIACGRLTTIESGRHAGLTIEGPEYETIFAFGGLCMIDSIEEIAYLNDICDRLGMDTISAGNICGFAIEAARKGKIHTDLVYGRAEGIAKLLEQIAQKQGIGRILAGGVRQAARAWGMEDMAVHVKGLELPGYDPRVLKGSGLGFAVSDRGGCHLRATFHRPELVGEANPAEIGHKAELFVDYEDRLVLMDMIILCRFFRDLYPWKALGKIVEMTTGLPADKPALRKMAADVSDLVRRFNIREGLTPGDDHLPKRLYKEVLKTGQGITRAEVDTMVQEYYGLRGWDREGRPKEKG